MKTAAKGLISGFAFAALILLSPLSPALAQEGEELEGEELQTEEDFNDYLDDSEIGAGSCSPEALPGGSLTTCRFPLSGEGWEFISGPNTQVAIVEDFQFSTSAPCVVEQAEIVCRDLLVPLSTQTYRVNLLGYFLQDRRPTITVDREFDSVIGYIQSFQRLKTVFAGGSLTIEVFRAGSLPDETPVEVHLRRPGSDEIVSRARALDPGEQDGAFSLAIPEAGRFEFVSCAVDADQSCFRTGIPVAVEAIDAEVQELVEGMNNPDDERINIVFVGTGYESANQLRESATSLLSLDGEPIPVGDFGGRVDRDKAEYFVWGAFAIEPMAGNREKFNFWYVPTISTGSPISISHGPFATPEIDVETLGVGPHVVIVNMTTWGNVDGYRATGELPTFAPSGSTFDAQPAATETPTPTDNSDIRFGSVYLPIFDPDSVSDAAVLAHEFGHSIFGLRDEYEEYAQDLPTIGRPNCAIDQADAEALWADQVGEVDPMFDRWVETMTEAGFEAYINATRQDVTVGYVEGGCFSGQTGAVRPTANSLMNANIPVFGSVNRKRAQEVLDLWPEPTPATTTTTMPPTTLAPATTSSPSPETTELAGPFTDVGNDSGSDNPSSTPVLILGAILLVALVGFGVNISRRRHSTPPM